MAKHSKELTASLKLKHAQVAKAQERQDLLESEIKRYPKVHAEAEKQRTKIAEILKEIEDLEAQIDALTLQIAAKEREGDPSHDGGPVMLDSHAKKALADAAKVRRASIRKDDKAREALKKTVGAKHRAIAKAESQIDDIHRWGSDGFMDLEPELVTAAEDRGPALGRRMGRLEGLHALRGLTSVGRRVQADDAGDQLGVRHPDALALGVLEHGRGGLDRGDRPRTPPR